LALSRLNDIRFALSQVFSDWHKQASTMAITQADLYEVEKISLPFTVCVTGATGFLAGAIIERLLVAGHTVRGTMRNASNTSGVSHLLELPGASERLTFFSADLLKAGSFDEAVAGCDYVIHAASPFIINVPKGKEKEMLVEPAVKGVEHVLGKRIIVGAQHPANE
jgi:putative NADH-flavin reductase